MAGKVKEKSTKNKNKLNIKKFFLNLLKKCKKICLLIKKKIDSMNDVARKVMFLWIGIILFIIFLIVICNINNTKLSRYTNLENAMNEGTLDFVKSDNVYASEDSKLRIPLDALVSNGYVYEEDLVKTCDGYSVVYYNDAKSDYNIKSYINCKHYTTKGFSSNKK